MPFPRSGEESVQFQKKKKDQESAEKKRIPLTHTSYFQKSMYSLLSEEQNLSILEHDCLPVAIYYPLVTEWEGMEKPGRHQLLSSRPAYLD